MNKRQVLRRLLASERPLLMPDAYDCLSARLIELAGFKAVQCSGYSMAIAARAASEDEFGFTRNLEVTRDIVRAVSLPVMADGEDGFGSPASIPATVVAFIDAGVAGINIEDQVLPSGKTKAVIEPQVMVEKIRVARRTARENGAEDLVINARTDALAACAERMQGIAESIERGNRYLEAGADLVFVTRVATLEEARRVTDGIRGPVSVAAGMPDNIHTLSLAALRECGVVRVSLPSIAIRSAAKALKTTLSTIRATDSFQRVLEEYMLCSEEELSQVLSK